MSELTLRANSSRPALTLTIVRARRDIAPPLSQVAVAERTLMPLRGGE
jgi:hypothetical protein